MLDLFLQSLSSINLCTENQCDKIKTQIMRNFEFAITKGVLTQLEFVQSKTKTLDSSAVGGSTYSFLSSSASAFTPVCGSASQLQAPTQVLSESLEAPAPASPHQRVSTSIFIREPTLLPALGYSIYVASYGTIIRDWRGFYRR